MGQRNMLCSNQMLDLEMDQQGQGHLPPEPCFLLGNIANFPHPNAHQVLVASGNTSTHEFHHVPGHPDSNFFQYNCIQHHCPVANVDMGIGAPSGFYNPYMMHSSATRMYPVSLNHSSSNHLPSSSHPGQFGVSIDDYERNNHFMDYVSRSSGKRKNAEGVPGNYLNLNGSASSSSSSTATQLNTIPHQWEEQSESGTTILDVVPFLPPDYRSNGLQAVTEGASERSVRSRSSTIGLQLDSALAHNQNHLVQGNYMGQSFQPAASGWVERQFMTNGSDGLTSIWNHSPDVPYLYGRNVNGGPLEIMSMGGQGYQDMTSSRNAAVLFHSPSMHHQYHQHLQHHHHHPSPPVQAMRGHNYSYPTQVPIPSYRHPTSNPLQHGPLNPSRDGVETVPRHSRPLPSNGLRMYRPHRNGGHHITSESRNHPHLRFLSAEEIAILEIPGFYEVGNSSDQHREMRLDIDDMSYEELLALGEQIGSVKIGLSEETILRQLKTRMHVSSATPLDKSDDMECETGTCIICQVEYQNMEKIGTLDCGHEYHAGCIKQWLLVKNVCPICKTLALTGDEMDE